MKKDTNILAELKTEAPVLVSIGNIMPYTLPSDYFEGISETVLAQISTSSFANVAAPFTAPANYFNNLSEDILVAIREEQKQANEVKDELDAIAPLLNTINKANIYTVPQGYFNTLNTTVENTTSVGKVVSISSVRRKIVYIAAACVIGIMAVSAFIFTKNSNKIDYAAYKHLDVNSTIDKLSNEELLNYLENVNSITNANSLTTLDVKLPEIQDHIQTISDEELKQYLKEVDLPSNDEQQLGI